MKNLKKTELIGNGGGGGGGGRGGRNADLFAAARAITAPARRR